ncbi:competence protein CoiA family protein [Vibrio paucivorans]
MPLESGWILPEACAELKVSDVQIEVYMDGRRPDLVVEVGSEQYWIEIANKHKCDADKIWDCRVNNKNVIEIDVSECEHLDAFDSLDNCLVRVQSLNTCNDYLDEIARVTSVKHEKVRKQFQALRRSQEQLEEKQQKHDDAEKTLEQSIETQQKRYNRELEKLKLRKDTQDKLLEELDRAIDAQEIKLAEIEKRKLNLESEINGKIQAHLAELEKQQEVASADLKLKLINDWQKEVVQKRQDLEEKLEAEYLARFAEEEAEMVGKREEHIDTLQQLTFLTGQKAGLEADIKDLESQKDQIFNEELSRYEQILTPLKDEQESLTRQVAALESQLQDTMKQSGLVDTYANNLTKVQEFMAIQSNYHDIRNQHMRALRLIEEQCSKTKEEHAAKLQELDIMVKLANEYALAFKKSFSLIEQTDLLSKFPSELVSRIKKNQCMRSRNAEEELEDYYREES